MNLEQYRLSSGKHITPTDGMCVMELVSYIAMEPWSDRPQCTSPVIAEYCRAFNDTLPDAERQRLKSRVHQLVGLRNDDVEQQLAYMCADRAVRVFTPMALHTVGLDAEAGRLSALDQVVDAHAAEAAAHAASAASAARNAGFALLDDMIDVVTASIKQDAEEMILQRIAALPDLLPISD